ncbi:serine/threonine-protein kinase [Dactylosporangium sp. NPDC005572]|uniref:serine/threonine-protein kinase n=1 Tax=Dactylosporangium sp. NPDC005572 TaxID=3156889 RepID=UPI0033AE2EA3
MKAADRLKDRYEVRHPIARSGMGEVWLARDTQLDRTVIIKTINPSRLTVDLVRRFRREARLTARLDHPGVPAVFDLDNHDGEPYLVLQRIEGIPLTDLIAEQDELPIARVCSIGAQISSVLLAAHRIGLVHRDLKPGNVMVEHNGAVKVLDFGVAVIDGDERYSRITRTGEGPGTVGYMAPEQIDGAATDHRTDLYGLGGVLFDLLTGQPPFGDATTMTTVRRQLGSPAPRPSLLRPQIPEALDDLVHALLALRPDDRPADAAEVYEVLAALADDPPPIPGVISDELDPVRAYAAVVGRQPVRHGIAPNTTAGPADRAAEADHQFAQGNVRVAARLWRELADEYANDHPLSIEYRLRAARAHVAAGERDRALRQFEAVLADLARADGAEHPQALTVRAEIEQLRYGAP